MEVRCLVVTSGDSFIGFAFDGDSDSSGGGSKLVAVGLCWW